MRKIIGLLLLTTACSGIVKKPEVFTIKKLAIVGMQTNQGIYNIGEVDKGFSFFSLPGFSRKNDKSNLPQIPETGGFRLVDYGLNTFEEELAKIKGWQVVPAIKVVGSPAYKEYARAIQNTPERTIASEILSQWYSPQGMTPIGDQTKIFKRNEAMKEIQKVSEKLGLDAVVFVNMDLAYAPDNSINTGAFASVASSLKVIAKTGTIVVSTPEVTNGSGERYFSDTSSPGLGKQLVFNDEIEAMYKSAIQKSAASLRDKINKEL
jgi:hypothetical protein